MLVIPSTALVQKNGEYYVYVIKDNIAFQRTVKIGLKNSQGVQVVEGLQDGEQGAISQPAFRSQRQADNKYG